MRVSQFGSLVFALAALATAVVNPLPADVRRVFDDPELALYTDIEILGDRPAIVYAVHYPDKLYFVRCGDLSCDPSHPGFSNRLLRTASDAIAYPDLAVVHGLPVVSYQYAGGTWREHEYIRCGDETCDPSHPDYVQRQLNAETGYHHGAFSSVAVVDGLPAISYYGHGDLKYLRCGDPTCDPAHPDYVQRSLVGEGLAKVSGQYTSLTVVGGLPAISYYSELDGYSLMYIRCGDVSCDPGHADFVRHELDDTNGIVGEHTSLAVFDGLPLIAYYASDPENDLKLVACGDETCDPAHPDFVIRLLDSVNDVGKFASLASIGGLPAVSYFDDTLGDLKIVFCGGSRCDPAHADFTILRLDEEGDVGQYDSLAEYDGYVAISYSDRDQYDLRYYLRQPELVATPAAPGPLAMDGYDATLQSVNLGVSNPGSCPLDLSLVSVSAGYTVSGLPIGGLTTADGTAVVQVGCTVPQDAGLLTLVSNEAGSPEYQYAVSCTEQAWDGVIGDRVFSDENGNGVDDAEPGLPGITVFVDSNDNGVLDPGEPAGVSDVLGAYDVSGLAEGSYTMRVDPASVPHGRVLTTGNLPLVVALAAGETYSDADFGYLDTMASVGDRVFSDENGNGVDDTEPGLAGITVFVDSNENGSLDPGEPDDTSDASGAYLIAGLDPGSYTLRVDPATVEGLTLTTGNMPLAVTLAAAEDNTAADFGYLDSSASVGDRVFEDENNNGVDDGEPGLPGITVFVDLNGNGSLDAGEPNDTSSVSGAYAIIGLDAGAYTVRIDSASVPDGYTLTTGNLPLGLVVAETEDYTAADFGYFNTHASVGDRVFEDENNNGVDDAEPGLPGITVFVDLNDNGSLDAGEPNDTTDSAGWYVISGLEPGGYTLRTDPASIPVGYALSTGNLPLSVTLAAGEDDRDADFGYFGSLASVGDRVFSDANNNGVDDSEAGLAWVTVYLDLNGNTNLDAGEPNDTTDAAGTYIIGDLEPGGYSLRVDPATVPVGYSLTTGNLPLTVTLAAGEDNSDADFGYFDSRASIGDRVFEDANDNGIDDAEPGLAGVTVFVDLNENGSFDIDEPDDTTDTAGSYVIDGLEPGGYTVRVNPASVPDGYTLTTGNLPLAVTLAAGEDSSAADFGYFDPRAAIGDRVWLDVDGNGLDDSEPGINGVTVYLDLDGNESLDAGEPNDTTDVFGMYSIPELAAGTYAVRTDPSTLGDGYVLTTGSLPLTVDLAAGQHLETADLGYWCTTGSLSGQVWLDVFENGLQDGGEPGVSGVEVRLFREPAAASKRLAATHVGTALSDDNGYFGFTVETGQYHLEVDFPEALFTTWNSGTDDSLDSDVDPSSGSTAPFILEAGDALDSIDVGLLPGLGDLVWSDLNRDGIQDGDEPGVAGVTARLLDASLEMVATTVSDADGGFAFVSLPGTGSYYVEVPPPPGFTLSPAHAGNDQSTDSDVDPATGRTGVISYIAGSFDTSVDAGLLIETSIFADGFESGTTESWSLVQSKRAQRRLKLADQASLEGSSR